MCDILVALPDATASGNVVFGKNSDRPAGECQVLCPGPDTTAADSGLIRCAHVEVPLQPGALRTLGCRPYWCWGYETGMNEAGVVGGNTAIYTRARAEMAGEPYGLLGMELLRFGLERGRSAEESVSAIVDLLEHYGQWGPAVQGKGEADGCYENAFVVVDEREAWLLETAGRRWVARRQREGTLALSNELTIRDDWTKASGDLEEHAFAMEWWTPGPSPFDFALAYSDHEHYARQVSHIRWMRANQLLSEYSPDIDVHLMMCMLRDHYEKTFLNGPQFNAFLPDFLTICMHDSPAAFTWGNTATSVVVEIDGNSAADTPFWVCYQPPCSSVYAAFFLSAPIPETVTRAGATARIEPPSSVPPDEFDESSLWWRMYRVLGGVAAAPGERLPELRSEFDALERDFHALVKSARNSPAEKRAELIGAIHRTQLESMESKLTMLEEQWHLTSESGEVSSGGE
jgi:secernin